MGEFLPDNGGGGQCLSGGSRAPPRDAYFSRLRRHSLTSSGGALDPPMESAAVAAEVAARCRAGRDGVLRRPLDLFTHPPRTVAAARRPYRRGGLEPSMGLGSMSGP